MEISNFYTVTIYEKGAEVVRMIHTLLGPELFRQGSDLYFKRHDGQAVTCEDFVKAMEDASGLCLQQFRRWYSQAGTPVLDVTGSYDSATEQYTLTVKQSCPATPECSDKKPFHIPLAIALLGDAGDLPLKLQGQEPDTETADNTQVVLNVTAAEQRFIFEGVSEEPAVSLLRGCSAPVKWHFDYSRDQLMFLMSRDSDGFCRWDAAQQLAVLALQDMIEQYQSGQSMQLDSRLLRAFSLLIADNSLDKAMVALMLSLPSEAYLAELSEVANVHAIHAARLEARRVIASSLQAELLELYRDNCNDSPYSPNAEQIAQRSLKNTALAYLMLLQNDEALQLCLQQYRHSHNMTDRLSALSCLVNSGFAKERAAVLEDFYQQWQHEALVLNQWFAVQAACPQDGALEQVKALMQHRAFDFNNPNKLRALLGTFCSQNSTQFHLENGEGYKFLADQIIALDALNPQIAARLLGPLSKWRKYPLPSQQLMQAELKRIVEQPNLSPDVYEVASKSLQ